MRYFIRVRGEVIGESRLERSEGDQCRASGLFLPQPAFEKCRYVFGLLADSKASKEPLESAELLHEYCQARDALGLELATEEGTSIPVSVINVIDSRAPGEAALVEVMFPDPHG